MNLTKAIFEGKKLKNETMKREKKFKNEAMKRRKTMNMLRFEAEQKRFEAEQKQRDQHHESKMLQDKERIFRLELKLIRSKNNPRISGNVGNDFDEF